MEKINHTAVSWLFQHLWDTPKDKLTWYAILKEAKEMEKEQIMAAYGQGVADEAKEILDVTSDAECYYRSTYGKY